MRKGQLHIKSLCPQHSGHRLLHSSGKLLCARARVLSEFPASNVVGNTACNYARPIVNILDSREDRYNPDSGPYEKDIVSHSFCNGADQSERGQCGQHRATYPHAPACLCFSINETHTFNSRLLNTLVVGETHNLYTRSPDTSTISLKGLGVTISNLSEQYLRRRT